jgi:Ca-activated chloride channel family protein
MRRSTFVGSLFGLTLTFLSPLNQVSQAAEAGLPVDVALVFAIDGSGSVKRDEFRLQVAAIAEAISAPDITRAIQSGIRGRIAVNFVIWGDGALPSQTGEWRIIRTPEDALAFGMELQSQQRQTTGCTGITAGVGDSLLALGKLPILADRKVVDVSGDGSETTFIKRKGKIQWDRMSNHSMVAELARKMDVTINGITLPSDESDLADWYRKNVAFGANSFVMSVTSRDDFIPAMHRKLLREIGPVATAGLQ